MTIELRHGVPHVTHARRGRKSGIARRWTKQSELPANLLVAIGVGLAIGAGVALAVRERSRRQRPLARLERAARRRLKDANRVGERGAKWAARHGDALRDRVPVDELKESVAAYLAAARQTIDDAVSAELRDLRKAVRHRRKRLGV